MIEAPTYAAVLAAADRIRGMAVRTPLLHSPVLSERCGGRVFIKPECLQRTGSFKFRGAWNAVSNLGDRARAGIVACSSGNHAQGVAEAARLAGAPATIVMPNDAPSIKRERTEASGAKIVGYDRATEDRDAIAQAVLAEMGGSFIHPYDDPDVIAGQGTIGLEIADDLDAAGLAAHVVLVPCSGGGLTAGVTLAMTERFPGVAVWAVEPAGFDDYRRSLASGRREKNPRQSGSISDALMSPSPGAIGFEINRTRLAGALAVEDASALAAVGCAFESLRLVAEPGGAIALAALLDGAVGVAGRTVVVVLSGGNTSPPLIAEAVAAYRGRSGQPARSGGRLSSARENAQ